MKKISAMIVSFILLMSMSACGTANDKESSKSTETTTVKDESSVITTMEQSTDISNVENNDSSMPYLENPTQLNDILSDIDSDFDKTIQKISDEKEKVYGTVGNTYTDYKKNKQVIKDWYTLINTETEKLYKSTREKCIEYYKAMESYCSGYDELNIALDNIYDIVYDNAYNKIYNTIYDEMLQEIYSKYYDGVLSNASSNTELGYDEFEDMLNESSDFYSEWLDVQSELYSNWLDEESDFYSLWLDISSKTYDDNFNIDSIINKVKE